MRGAALSLWAGVALLLNAHAVGAGDVENQQLWDACKEGDPADGTGDVAAVSKALPNGADVNAGNPASLGATALSSAASSNYSHVVLFLLENGADVDAVGKTKRTALMWAARWGHQDVVRVLLGAGADTTLIDASKMTAEDIANAKGQPHIAEIIKANIAKKIRDVYSASSPDKLGAVPNMMLKYATPWGYSETSPNKRELKLLEHLTNLVAVPGASNIEEDLAHIMEPIMAEEDAALHVKWAAEKAAQDAAEAAEENEKTATERALAQELDEAMPGVRQKVEAFYKEHNPEKLGQVNSILFKYKGREEQLLADLEERYGTPGGSQSSTSPTPTPNINDGSAIADIRAKVNEFYKIHNPAKIDQLDSIFFKYKGREQELLKDLEARYGKIDGSAADAPQDPPEPPPPPPPPPSPTPTPETDNEAEEAEEEEARVFDPTRLQQGGVYGDLASKDASELLELLFAAIQDVDEEAALFVLDGGAEVDGIRRGDSQKYTPLMLASAKGLTKLVETLIAKGANINAKSVTGRTPLMWGTRWAQLDVVRALITAGADLKARDKGGHTAYKIAKTKIGGDVEETLLAAEEGRPLPEPEPEAPAEDEKEL